jgi:hypothetical protein
LWDFSDMFACNQRATLERNSPLFLVACSGIPISVHRGYRLMQTPQSFFHGQLLELVRLHVENLQFPLAA